MDRKESKTEKNLRAAFSRGAERRGKHLLYADIAKREGYAEIADALFHIAEVEGVHTALWLEELGELGGTEENLRCSTSLGEEEREMYERFARDAEEEGYAELAFRFRAVGGIGQRYEEHLHRLLSELHMKHFWERTEEVIWECRSCGYLSVGRRAPEKCSVCHAGKTAFVAK